MIKQTTGTLEDSPVDRLDQSEAECPQCPVPYLAKNKQHFSSNTFYPLSSTVRQRSFLFILQPQDLGGMWTMWNLNSVFYFTKRDFNPTFESHSTLARYSYSESVATVADSVN